MSKNPMPKKVVDEVLERDEGVCQLCGRPASELHHIFFGGVGRKKIHTPANLMMLCWYCHKQAHQKKKVREACEEWARINYGPKVEELKRAKWEDSL